jgi:MFS transporter, AAHS family, 4-hydroxybenzoate transporter
MAQPQTIDIARIIDERRMTGINATVVILCFFIILFDGYDGVSIAFAGPYLVKEWGIASMAALGTAFSASLFGFLFGAALFGWVGDNYGRKTALILASLVCGVFSLLTMFVGSLIWLIVMRFLTGLGLGGMVPLVLVLTGEYSPKRVRATMMIIMFCGITFGGVFPGPIAGWLAPTYGWQVLFFVGGVTPIIMALISMVWLPESLKYLVVSGQHAAIVPILKKLSPSLVVSPGARFVLGDERNFAKFRPSQLFVGPLMIMTPLLWLCFVLNLMSFYFINTWLPTVLVQAQAPHWMALLSTSIFQFGGTLGGLAVARPIDKMGLRPVCVLFVCALFTAPLLGYSQHPEGLLSAMIFLAGFTLLGLQFGLNAVSAMIYPTSIRSNGSGWAFAVGRFGAVAGPIVAGVLLSLKLDIQHLFLFLYAPIAIGTIASLVLARLYAVQLRVGSAGEPAAPGDAVHAAR